MKKIALLIGIDKYDNCKSLNGCEVDAVRIADLLKKNHDNTSNFTCEVMHTGNTIVSEDRLTSRLRYYFNKPADDLLIYFSGHGSRSPMNGYLTVQDSTLKRKGIPMQDIMLLAAKRKSKRLTMIIDACYSGNIGNAQYLKERVLMPKNSAIITSSSSEEVSMMKSNRSVFSYLIEEGLSGAAANSFGEVNIASLYELADRNLTSLEQRPEFKTNLTSMSILRIANPTVSEEARSRLLTCFPKIDDSYRRSMKENHVNPSYLNVSFIDQYYCAGWVEPQKEKKQGIIWKLSVKGKLVWKYCKRLSQIHTLS